MLALQRARQPSLVRITESNTHVRTQALFQEKGIHGKRVLNDVIVADFFVSYSNV